MEEQQQIFKKKRPGRVVISTTISIELHKQAQDYNIKWSEALMRGITQILMEKENPLYTNPLQMERKIAGLIAQLQETSFKMHDYKDELERLRGGK